MSVCWSCGDGHVIIDPASGAQVCDACGIEHASADQYQTELFDGDGRPTGFHHFIGDFGDRERKIRDAQILISDLTAQLGLSGSRADEAAKMVSDVTDGSYGAGDWFPVLIAACSYLVMRRHRLPLPINEVAATIGRDAREVSRMVTRVAAYLDLAPLPEFDAAQSLVRAVRFCPCLAGIPTNKSEEVIGQGRFLLQCATRWFLTTGRHPLPIVAAVLAFVSEVNGVTVSVEEIASEIYAGATTSKIRLKELKDTLIKVARVLLPWGADVTAKNLAQNGPLLIRFMELKSKSRLESGDSLGFELDMDGLVESLADPDGNKEDSNYFKAGGGEGGLNMSADELCGIKISAESLTLAYKNVLARLAEIKGKGEIGMDKRKKSKRGVIDLDELTHSWHTEGRWEADKKLTLEQVLEKDVGYDALPPSFVANVEARKSRRVRIEAARSRINGIMKSRSATKTCSKDSFPKSLIGRTRKRRGVPEDSVDWEDCIIELLLLHGVAEDEIEQGQYRRLLDLHIFN